MSVFFISTMILNLIKKNNNSFGSKKALPFLTLIPSKNRRSWINAIRRLLITPDSPESPDRFPHR
jgi:hypothetical protein